MGDRGGRRGLNIVKICVTSFMNARKYGGMFIVVVAGGGGVVG